MSTSASDSAWLARAFEATDIAAVNAHAAMLQRLDNKYIIEADTLEAALPMLARQFEVLEIDGRRAFSYENCYFDGPLLPSYFDHHQGRRKRSKVRMRRYADSGLCFVEIKLKDKRGITVKRRMPCDADDYGFWTPAAQGHIEAAYLDLYGQAFPHALDRALDTNYTRMTLVAKQ